MFKNILLPTDGSALSEIAIQKSIALAKVLGAKITGLYVIPEYQILTWQAEMLTDTSQDFKKLAASHAEKFLAVISDRAKEAGVPAALVQVTGEHPYEAILKAADDNKCDLITMASHGRKGIQGFLIGSETQKVLVHSKIPVLVYR
ncbi:universal stress protein [Herminiimonas sp. KBW02]|uniref:universal stress protein n=1 Tax=Herminiimonas sp. KBW02 TaxID=2153363 RepID=UPI000F591B4B|nr:universal stress protein [Herminiimonas sp. KBW02]RQO36474.1 universal stress protein [Herminiimonas sp. KBW02]